MRNIRFETNLHAVVRVLTDHIIALLLIYTRWLEIPDNPING